MSANKYLSHIAYDSVIFGFSEEKLKVLVLKYHNTGLYALPGGFVDLEEDLDKAVRKGLRERTGLKNIYLEQFYTFGDLKRFRPTVMETILKANGHSVKKNAWMLERFVSVAYYALIDYEVVRPRPDELSDSCDWYDVDRLPKLMLDHKEIVRKALQTLRENLEKKLVGVNLLPRFFTMNELQKAYEVILDEKLHHGIFQRKCSACIGATSEAVCGAHKAP
jgi:ADP-ribose pyrophosphatase YjhB (NUDIX family)